MNNSVKPAILIGNGFNLALDANNINALLKFRYDDIKNEVEKKLDSKSKLSEYLKQRSDANCDIEYLLWVLKKSKICIDYCSGIYCNPMEPNDHNIEEDCHKLKNIVIEIMTSDNMHPEHNQLFNENYSDKINTCKNNLKVFDKIFTTNYDLILYWLLNHNNHELLKTGGFKDGFTPNTDFRAKTTDGKYIKNLFGFNTNNPQANILFLHGAIHLLQQNNKAYKVTKEGNTQYDVQDLQRILLNNLSKNDYSNLLIFDASSDDKIKQIYDNSYLQKAYDKLSSINEELIIYGNKICQEDDHGNWQEELSNDKHLWRKIINSSKIKKIYISNNNKDKDKLDEQAKQIVKVLRAYNYTNNCVTIHVYSHHNINIWETDNFYDSVIQQSSEGIILKN